MKIPIVQLIQGMLAPGLMISACGLLLLGMNNKYSLVVNRIRLLNEEKRKIFHQESIDESESSRLSNIELQISHLIERISLGSQCGFQLFNGCGPVYRQLSTHRSNH